MNRNRKKIPWYLDIEKNDKPIWSGAERLLHLFYNADLTMYFITIFIKKKNV